MIKFYKYNFKLAFKFKILRYVTLRLDNFKFKFEMGSGQTKSTKTEKNNEPARSSVKAPIKKPARSNIKSISKQEIDRIQSECLISEAEIKNKYQIFMAFSDNGNKLNEKGFYEMCLSLKNEIPDHLRKYSNLVFGSIDTDHDHYISFHEFIIAYQSILRGDLKKKLEYTFLLYDSDGSGRLDVKKIKNITDVMLKILQADKFFNSQAVAEGCFALLDRKKFGAVAKGIECW